METKTEELCFVHGVLNSFVKVFKEENVDFSSEMSN